MKYLAGYSLTRELLEVIVGGFAHGNMEIAVRLFGPDIILEELD